MAEQIQPKILDADVGYRGRYMAVIFNNDANSFAEVLATVMYATSCTIQEAYMETWEAHHYGSAPIYFGSQEVCCAVSAIISNIGVRTEVRPEWED